MKLIDVTGLGHSGKTAVTDLLRELDGVHVHHNSFEFNLLRLPDGIIDLHHALCEKWSPSRSDFAIKRFRRLCESLNMNYSEALANNFMQYTEKYMESLVIGSLFIDGWYDSLYEDRTKKERVKTVLKNMGLFKLVKKVYTIINSNRKNSGPKTEVYLSNDNNFNEKTTAYLEKVLFSNSDSKFNTVVTNNAFEPFNPQYSIRFFNNAYSVIVDRDPRDIYASIIKVDETYLPKFETDEGLFSKEYIQELKENMLGVENINTFIIRQKLYREKMQIQNNNPRVLYLNYEDLVLKYDDTIQAIFSKVGIEPDRHTKKKHFFDPAQSVKNVGIWKKMKDSKEIKLIENKLNKYLYHFE